MVAILTTGVPLVTTARAQSSEAACSMGMFRSMALGLSGRVAYSATARTTFEQTLGDGSYVRGFMVTHKARDSSGRTRTEMAHGCQRGENGQPQPEISVFVNDPTTKTSLNWQTGPDAARTAQMVHQTEVPRKTQPSEQVVAIQKAAQRNQPPHSEFETEDLGVRTIAGVEAHGSRTTRTIPAGEEGNELPLVVEDQHWDSLDLGLTVYAVHDDPRFGRTTFEIEELSRAEPDTSFFLPPPGYKTEDRTPGADPAQKP